MKTPSNGLWQENRQSSSISLQTLQICYLIFAGVAVVALHARFHWPIKVPGHHGLEWLAILIFARSLSTLPNAAFLVALSAAAATIVPVWGFHDNSAAGNYLVAGIAIDLAYLLPPVRRSVLMIAVAGGLAHAFKPLLHWAAATGFGVEHGSLRHGLPYLLTLHFLFGFTGATTGAALARITRKARRS